MLGRSVMMNRTVPSIAFAFVLLAGSGLLIRSFFRMQDVETGFDDSLNFRAPFGAYDKA